MPGHHLSVKMSEASPKRKRAVDRAPALFLEVIGWCSDIFAPFSPYYQFSGNFGT
jgi:hypothetical protein